MKKHPPTARSRTAMSCSTCGRKFFLDETETPPFCSERCQMIDLGRWLDESIGVPFEGDPEATPVEHRGSEDRGLDERGRERSAFDKLRHDGLDDTDDDVEDAGYGDRFR